MIVEFFKDQYIFSFIDLLSTLGLFKSIEIFMVFGDILLPYEPLCVCAHVLSRI